MVHDRRIDGITHTFGNAGALFMNAMTWWDHETESTWSQPWGRAINGELIGTELHLLPSQLTTWAAWKAEHPSTLAMTNDMERLSRHRQVFDTDFVIGLVINGRSKAYYYSHIANETILNDQWDEFPVLMWAQNNNFHAYLRQIGEQTLTFAWQDEQLIDLETGSTWNVARGLATDGPLVGENLQPIPSSSSYDWAWLDFYPEAQFYDPVSN